MKISTRLSITSFAISSTVFIAFGVTVYLFSSFHQKQDFQGRLRERIVITEKVFLEKESFGQLEFEKITNEFLHTLPEETVEVLLLKQGGTHVFKYQYPKDVQSKMLKLDTWDFAYSNRQGACRKFMVNGGNYLVVVTAVDTVGLQNLSFLKKIIFLLVLIGVPLIFIGNFIITKRALLPISKKIDKANTISASNLHQRLNVHNPDDELGKMAIAFNGILDRLESAFESQKSFIRNASHEIRSPLTAIMGEAEIVISKSRTNEEYFQSMKTILTEADILNATVNNLLQLSKVSANEENIQYEIIHFDLFLMEVKESFNFFNPQNKIKLNINKQEKKEGAFTISGNKNLLKTAIINLFDNACKFSSNQQVSVLLSRDNEHLILTIKDKGIGIFDKDLENILTPFYRGNNAIKIKGSGIGLSLSSKIILLHQGVLKIQSKIGIGTEVIVELPFN